MKTKFLLTFCMFSFVFSNAQIIDIPDANFKAVLLQADFSNQIAKDSNDNYFKIDSNNDGEIQLSETQAVYYLNVGGQNIYSLDGIENFTQLTNFNCTSNYITSLDMSGNVNLEILLALYCSISTVNLTNNVNLLGFHLGYNNIQSIDISQNLLLTSIFLNGNNITNFELPQGLDLMNCDFSGIPLGYLDLSVYPNLEYLHCDSTGLAELDVTNNPLLESLSFRNNQISSIDVSQNPLLQYFYGSGNNLSTIDVSSNPQLEVFKIGNNQISSLDVSQNSLLEFLNAGFNLIPSVDVSQNPLLRSLDLFNNELSSIDIESNTNLETLSVFGNEIVELDLSNNPQLRFLDVNNNPIEFLNIKNGTTFEFLSAYNIDAPSLSFICADEAELEQIASLVNPSTIVNSYCSFVPGGDSFTIQGDNKIDMNSNGCDVDDFTYPYLKFSINDGTTSAAFVSNATGNYEIPLPEGTYSIVPLLENPDYYTVSPNAISVNFPEESSPYIQDFCLAPNGVHNDLEVYILPITQAIPGFDSDYKIVYKNVGNTLLSGTVDLDYSFDSDYMQYVSSVPTETSEMSHILSWDYLDLAPFETREILVTFSLNTPTDSDFPLNSGDELNFETTIYPTQDDEAPANNDFGLEQIVVNSYDPNDIRCLEGESILPERVGEYVHYLIRFENLGTTNATNIVVNNAIDTSKFDISTLVPLDGSHDYFTRINPNNDAEFIFENINLPFDDATNDGYVLYKIKTLESLVLGDTFANQAEIYFDFNAPVITNTYTTEVTEDNLSVLGANQNRTIVYPNPVNDILTIESDTRIGSVILYDVNGRIISNSVFNDALTQLDVSLLKTGIYFLKVFSNTNQDTLKIVKK